METMRKSSIFVDSNIKEDFKFLEDSLKAALKYFRSVEKGELGSEEKEYMHQTLKTIKEKEVKALESTFEISENYKAKIKDGSYIPFRAEEIENITSALFTFIVVPFQNTEDAIAFNK